MLNTEDKQNVNQKIDELALAMNQGFATLDKKVDDKIDELAQAVQKSFMDVDEKFDKIDEKFEAVYDKFDKVDQRFESIDKRFESIDQRFDEVLTGYDQLMKVMLAERDENVAFRAAMMRHEDKIEQCESVFTDHEIRITVLEKQTISL